MSHEETDGFEAHNYDRANKLLDLLADIGQDEQVARMLALHGGTEINGFILDLPRLSVDVDLSLVTEDTEPDKLKADREQVLAAVSKAGRRMGYRADIDRERHAGQTIKFTGPSSEIKADVIFMNRVLPFGTVTLPSRIDPAVSFPIVSPYDTFGGKLRALLDRQAVRDLYDIRSISRFAGELDPKAFHGALLLYASLTSRFPEALWKVRNLKRYVELPPEEGVTHPLWEHRVNVAGTGIDEIGDVGHAEPAKGPRDISDIGDGRQTSEAPGEWA